MGDGEAGRDAGAWRGFLLLAGLVAFPAIGAGAGSATQTGGSGQARDWLDRIAPVGRGSYREAGGGLILFGVVTLAGGMWLLLAMPFSHQLRHLPAGPLGILAVIAGVYFLLLAVNVFRRTPK
jgi:hypothetical protein